MNISAASEPGWLSTAKKRLRTALGSSPAMESRDLEWKEKYSKKEDRWADHLSAFANLDGGGYIVFGIEDSGAVVGVEADQAREIEAKLRNTGDLGVEPPVTIDAQPVTWEDGKTLLFVHVHEGATRPVRTRVRGDLTDDKKVCVRRGASTVEASVSEIRQMMMANRPLQWEQLRATKKLSLSDVEHLLDFETLCDLLQKPRPSRDALPKWLEDERLIDLDGNGAFITNFGAIAAARDLTAFDPLDRKALRIIHYQGLNKVVTKEEIMIAQGYAVSFQDTLRQLMKILTHQEQIRGGIRQVVHAFPELAVRELLANALIHQNFHLTGTGPQIEVFDDRVEFFNPGGPVSGVASDRLIGTSPRSRNEIMARKFREYRLCEERGTGFQKVIDSLESSGASAITSGRSYPPVAFRTDHETFRVVLYREKPFSELSLDERVEVCYQHAISKYYSSSVLTNTTLRQRFRVSAAKQNIVTQNIGEAVKRGRIKRINPGTGHKGAQYVPYWA